MSRSVSGFFFFFYYCVELRSVYPKTLKVKCSKQDLCSGERRVQGKRQKSRCY